MLIILYVTCILSVASQLERLISAKIRDNNIIAIYHNLESYNLNARVFELKSLSTRDIFEKAKVFDLGSVYEKVDLVMLDIPNSLQESKNKLWVKFKHHDLTYDPATSPFMNWIGYINLDNVTLKNDSSLIKFPTHENFPVKGYTINTITNGVVSALFVTGGELYSKKDNIYSASNSFYRYDFASKEWVDMAYSVGGKLEPLLGHKSVVIKNRYLVILGGRKRIIYNPKPSIYDFDHPEFEYNSLNNLTIFDTFNNSWENVNININIFNTNTTSIKFSDALVTVYKDKIIAYVGRDSNSRSNIKGTGAYLGTLDLESKNWNWSSIIIGSTRSYKSSGYERDLVVFSDQLIIFSDYNKTINDVPIGICGIDNKVMWPDLISPNSWNETYYNYKKNEEQNLPTYAIVIIAISWAVLPGALMILLYSISENSSNSKDGNTNNNGPIREVWANPDIINTNNTGLWDRMKGLNLKKNNPNALMSNRLGSNTATSNVSNTIEFNK